MRELNIPIDRDDEYQIRNCITCLAGKHRSKPTTGMKQREVSKVFEHVHLDSTGKYKFENGDYYITIVVDHYSRYVHSFVTEGKDTINDTLAKWFKTQHILHGRAPKRITTDQGTEFSKIDYLLPTELYGNEGTDVYAAPHYDLAPTGHKEWNGTAERAIQTIKLLQKMVTAHLPQKAIEKYFSESVALATMIYNHLPHSSLEYQQPIGKYFNRKTDNIDEKSEYYDSQPARLFNGTPYGLPKLPMFLEDVVYFKKPKGKSIASKGYFIGYDSDYKILIYTGNSKKPQLLTDVTPLNSFELYRNRPLRKANQHLIASVTPATTIQPPSNIFKALKDPIWKACVDKEVASFLEHEVFEPCQSESELPEDSIKLHTFWLFNVKAYEHKPKGRLITINRDWVGQKNKEASSPVAKQLSCFLMFIQFALDNQLQISVYDISTAFLYAKIDDKQSFHLKTPLGFQDHIKTPFVRLRRHA